MAIVTERPERSAGTREGKYESVLSFHTCPTSVDHPGMMKLRRSGLLSMSVFIRFLPFFFVPLPSRNRCQLLWISRSFKGEKGEEFQLRVPLCRRKKISCKIWPKTFGLSKNWCRKFGQKITSALPFFFFSQRQFYVFITPLGGSCLFLCSIFLLVNMAQSFDWAIFTSKNIEHENVLKMSGVRPKWTEI